MGRPVSNLTHSQWNGGATDPGRRTPLILGGHRRMGRGAAARLFEVREREIVIFVR